ncbi:hypothetical protein M2161_009139 [Streptomyces sp. SAI-133]|nr:hypothetical protein [Streptomyces sp. SAI-133]MDH6589948.1 hypothetical protein [Streptomyces sp. SAI-133]
MNDDRTRIAVAALGTGLAALTAQAQPSLIPALTLALAVWVALAVFLKL